MSNFGDDFHETTRISFNLGWALLILGVAVAILGVLFTLTQLSIGPFAAQQQTQINRNSQGYVEAHQRQILGMVRDYERTETEIAKDRQSSKDTSQLERQQRATLDEMAAEAALLQPADVPRKAQDILRQNGRI